MKKFNSPSGKPPSVDQDAITRQLRINWLRTIGGILLMGGLSATVLYLFGMHWTVATVILLLFSVVMPVLGWYNSGALVLRLTKCKEPNMDNPDHVRLVRMVDELYPLTGLSKKPDVYVSPLPVPNAFATGRNPANAFIAATEGLFMVDLEDREIKAILAHELAHVKSRDVAITSLVSVLGSLFAIALAGVFPNWFRACFSETNSKGTSMLDKLTDKVRRDKKRFADPVTGVTGFFITILVFYIVSFLAKFVNFFVSRSRESAADALAAQWTKDPCALATALQKIVDWMNRNRAIMQMRILLEGMEPLLFVSLHEGEEGLTPKKPTGFFEKLRHRIRHLGDNHPPVEDRIVMLGVLAGNTCPRLIDIKHKKHEDFERLIIMRRRAFEEELARRSGRSLKVEKAEGENDVHGAGAAEGAGEDVGVVLVEAKGEVPGEGEIKVAGVVLAEGIGVDLSEVNAKVADVVLVEAKGEVPGEGEAKVAGVVLAEGIGKDLGEGIGVVLAEGIGEDLGTGHAKVAGAVVGSGAEAAPDVNSVDSAGASPGKVVTESANTTDSRTNS